MVSVVSSSFCSASLQLKQNYTFCPEDLSFDTVTCRQLYRNTYVITISWNRWNCYIPIMYASRATLHSFIYLYFLSTNECKSVIFSFCDRCSRFGQIFFISLSLWMSPFNIFSLYFLFTYICYCSFKMQKKVNFKQCKNTLWLKFVITGGNQKFI